MLLRSHLIQKLNSYLQVIDLKLINDFIAIYKHKNILLASFAQALYQLSSLNFIANQKVIGGELHKVLGRASKVISYKSLRMGLSMELRKNKRVYDLNTNEIETKNKIDIAKSIILVI